MSEFEDTIRIMIASDNHLGYCEKDPIRAKDSFAAFEEILQTAVETEVDMVLLGGDLFHENKPSRTSVFKAISLLRTYCLGNKPVNIRVVSQQDENFRNKRVNYEDPNFNVGLPVFSINGNHDDPTRESGAEALSACDILSAGNFLNYFGTASRINDINIKPVLIEKGNSKLALYGLGAVRDERLSRMFSKGKVKFVRPKEEVKEYFNMFVLHQNRDTGRGVKNCVHESFLPNFLDLVMWGHEHECKIDPVESSSGYHITQPGSSVATSLVDAESRKKHVAILSILGTDFKIEKRPLQNVRPFIYKIIKLSDFDELRDLNGQTHKIDIKVHDALTKYVYEAIETAHIEHDTKNGYPGLSRDESGRVLPLIRFKVERTPLKEGDADFPMLNIQRFGNQFAGKVANPSSLVKFFKAKKTTSKRHSKRREGEIINDMFSSLNEDGDGETGIGGVDMGSRILMELDRRDAKLELLPEPALNDALNKYVAKEEAQALRQFVNSTIMKTQKALRRRNDVGDDAAAIRQLIAVDTDRVRRENLPKKRKTRENGGDSSASDMLIENTSGMTYDNGTHTQGNSSKRRKLTREDTKARTTSRRQIQLENNGCSGATKQMDNLLDSNAAASNRSANEVENWNGEINHQASRARRRNDANKRRRSRRDMAMPEPNYAVDTAISDDDEALKGRESVSSKKEGNVVSLLDDNSSQDESFIPASDDDGEAASFTGSGNNQQFAGRVSNNTKNKTSSGSRTSKGRRRRYGARSQQKH